MIPWFIVNAIDAVTSRLGYDMTVECRADRRWTVEGFWLRRRPPGEPRAARLGPYRGGVLTPADSIDLASIGISVVGDGFSLVDYWPTDLDRARARCLAVLGPSYPLSARG